MLGKNEVIFDKYKIIKKIGAGGMGTVYLAEELSSSEIYAIKQIDKTTKEYKESTKENGILTEILIVKELNHPLIPFVNDLFEDEITITIVMEYVDGMSLKDIIDRKGPLDEESCVRVAKDLCEIFIYLHTRPEPVIYKDLKPANIMLKNNGTLRLLDFGVAVIMHHDGSLSSNKPFGTKGFASPEHFTGRVDERSDIYTLGMTMYNLLTATTPQSKDFELMKQSIFCSRKLLKIMAKATQVDPDKRYQSASEMLKDLITYRDILGITKVKNALKKINI